MPVRAPGLREVRNPRQTLIDLGEKTITPRAFLLDSALEFKKRLRCIVVGIAVSS